MDDAQSKQKADAGLSFRSLDDTQFENFCYDLLVELEHLDVDWRKGTDLNASPSDRGRDITCRRELVGSSGGYRTTQQLFVECKHYERGVPPEKLQGALAWARLKRPDVLLIIASGFLSNACKDYLEEVSSVERPPFKIEVWERPKLEQLTIGRPNLLNKYGLLAEVPSFRYLHPIHLEYIRLPTHNTLGYLFGVLDALDHEQRDNFMGMTCLFVVNPRLGRPTSDLQTLGELREQSAGYTAFKQKCWELAKHLPEFWLSRCIVQDTLSNLFREGDPTREQEVRNTHLESIAFFRKELECTTHPLARQDKEDCIRSLQQSVEEVPKRFVEGYKVYVSFCAKVVAKLFMEPIRVPELPGLKEMMAKRYGGDPDA